MPQSETVLATVKLQKAGMRGQVWDDKWACVEGLSLVGVMRFMSPQIKDFPSLSILGEVRKG